MLNGCGLDLSISHLLPMPKTPLLQKAVKLGKKKGNCKTMDICCNNDNHVVFSMRFMFFLSFFPAGLYKF